MLDLDAIRALLDIHMGRGASKAALHAHILAYEHLVPALLSGLAAAQAAPVVVWRRIRDFDRADLGAMHLHVDDKGWLIRVVDLGTGDLATIAEGPETGPAGKAACEAAYRRAAGWEPRHARLEWTREFDDFSLVFHYDALPVKLWSGKLYSNGTGWAFNDSSGNLYNGAPLPKAEIVHIIAEWCATNLPSLHLPPFPGASDAS